MLNKLIFKVEFTTGKTIKGHHDFEKGLSAITGKNESGKSLRLEMIRYALFGAKALRGASTTYKSVSTWLSFTVNGQNYFIERNGSKVTLANYEGLIQSDGKNQIATGTKPVSQAIQKIFGYDLEVFDIANACLQGEVEAMTNKKPAERKKMVDRTIGLDSIDKLIDKVSADIVGTRQAINLLNDKVIEVYDAPVMPSNYVESEKLEIHLQGLQDSLNKKQFIEGKLSALKCEKPLELNSTEPKIEASLEQLYSDLQENEKVKAERDYLKNRVYNYLEIMDQLKEYNIEKLRKYIDENYSHKWSDYNLYIKKHVEFPGFLQQDLDFLEECFHIQELELNTTKVDCPKCNHHFVVLNDIGLFNKYFDHNLFENTKKIVGVTKESELRAKQLLLNKWSDFKELEIVEKPDLEEIKVLPTKAIYQADSFVDFDVDATNAQWHFLNLTYESTKINLTNEIAWKKKQDKEQLEFENQLKKYNDYLAYYDTVRDDLQAFEYVEAQIVTVRDDFMSARAYEKALNEYEIKQAAQSQALTTLADLNYNLEELVKVKKSLQELKPKVKSHLLPSLNKVASTLLAQMTNNERTSIVVDEEFEILVDGQPVNTLSGSGKAVANLAVRIGLGSVLTNKVFSVFLADEIDASMDEERAAYTAQCLQNLTSVINQIILVSHQQPEADHQIEV